MKSGKTIKINKAYSISLAGVYFVYSSFSLFVFSHSRLINHTTRVPAASLNSLSYRALGWVTIFVGNDVISGNHRQPFAF